MEDDRKRIWAFLGGIPAIFAFVFGIANFSDLRNAWSNFWIGPGSPEVQFIYGDWCADSGARQRFERTGDGAALIACLPEAHGVCAVAFASSLEALPRYNVKFGWADGTLNYSVGTVEQRIIVRRLSEDTFTQSLAGSGGLRLMRRCDRVEDGAVGTDELRNDLDQLDSSLTEATRGLISNGIPPPEVPTLPLQLSAVDMARELRSQLAAEVFVTGIDSSRTIVSFQTDPAFDDETLRDRFAAAITTVAEVVKQRSDASIEVSVHTDSSGNERRNASRSEERALAIADALVTGGIPRHQIMARGAGESQPVSSNATANGRQQNRRAEILINVP